MSLDEKLYLAVILVAFVGFLASLAAVTLVERRHERE